jgi:hypothetical protein
MGIARNEPARDDYRVSAQYAVSVSQWDDDAAQRRPC